MGGWAFALNMTRTQAAAATVTTIATVAGAGTPSTAGP